MKQRNFIRKSWALVLASIIAVVIAQPLSAKDDAKHPLRVLKARYQNDQNRGSSSSARGNLTVWVQNAVGVTVDGIEVEVELYNDRKRKVDTIRKKVGKLDAGEKRVLTFRWDVIAEREVKPKFFIEYNVRGNQKARFKGESPTWN